ncbi:esterase [Corallococcus sp. CA053C]|uniref:esterase family protein n=1 Tax=Corallococcus sp. CA053C TaxID=2316732 RepID=UPI000EA0797D|nr:alpha/beta hydrolase-fold protein [Corallococcus sp. CA053C]RKG99151.1 esterase [Corallococcus sp. CA053C]
MNREYHRWYSQRLNRDMEVLLYGHAGEPILLVPTSKGRFYQAEDFGLIGAIADCIAAGRYVVVCVDSVDEESWYNKDVAPAVRVARHAQWEDYLVHEAVPLVRSRASGGRLTLAGCSLGGFHTYNVGLRHPDIFQRLISMGGKFETDDFLDGHHDEQVYFHTAPHWLPGLHDPARLNALRRVEMTLAVGEHDFCRPSNENLSKLLWQKDIRNDLSIWDGGTHDWPVWRQMIRHYLPA